MELIKLFFAKVISGFLLGVGFILAAGVFGGYAISHMTKTAIESSPSRISTKSVEKDEDTSPMFNDYDESAKLSAYVKTEKIGNGSFTLLGEVENKGIYSWQMVNLQADLFNTKGQFIEQCTEYVSQTIRPGEVVNFKLSCKSSSCNTVDVNGYDSYVLKIADARYIREKSDK